MLIRVSQPLRLYVSPRGDEALSRELFRGIVSEGFY